MDNLIKLHADNKIFYEGCKKKKLIFQKCNKCNKIIWPYSFLCPNCYEKNLTLIESKGVGKIFTYTIFHIAFDKNFKNKIPYIVAIIKLDEGVKLLSNIIDSNLENIECEKRVKVIWEKNNEYFIPKFKLI